jgi:hypothetical protein
VRRRLGAWLENASVGGFSTYAVGAAFCAYFCMYAVRKPFAAGTFPGELAGVDLKTTLVLSQVIGYAASKFLGISLVSGLARRYRAAALLVLVGTAELALVAFGSLPPLGQVFAIFCAGLPLGMVWGLVFSFLEGRRTSEILGAGLSTSYIVASGAVKSVGRWLVGLGVPDAWMPAATGALFFGPFVLAVFLLDCLPAPSTEDQDLRTRRAPMHRPARASFFRQFAPGLAVLTFVYMFLTSYRDFRDNFAVDIWRELGEHGAAILTQTELAVALAVLLALAAIYRVRDNRRAFFLIHALMLAGALAIGVSTALFDAGLIGPTAWTVLVGTGLYLGYVPYGCVLFDRLIAATRVVATSVFMIYVTDAFGYLGSVGVLLVKSFAGPDMGWLDFFRAFSYTTSVVCAAGFVASMAYFREKTRLG